MGSKSAMEKYYRYVGKLVDEYNLDEDSESELYVLLCEKAESPYSASVYRSLRWRAQQLACRDDSVVGLDGVAENPYDKMEEVDAVRWAVSRLRSPDKDVITMLYFEDATREQCAERLGYTKQYINEIHKRATRKLAVLLTEEKRQRKRGVKREVMMFDVPRRYEVKDDVITLIDRAPTFIDGYMLTIARWNDGDQYVILVRTPEMRGYLRDGDTSIVPIEEATVYSGMLVPEAVIFMLKEGKLKLRMGEGMLANVYHDR